MTNTEFQVLKADLHQTRRVSPALKPLNAGEVRLHIEHFALTANNITYATFGDAMNYWQFFPTGEADWGCIPVWGFAVAEQSLCAGVVAGERFYGYFPMASTLVVQPARLTATGFYDGAAHRAGLHAVYNQYLRCSQDPLYSAATEDLQALLRPLFITSFLIDDFLADNDFFGACARGGRGVMLLSSASSKTAYGTAFQMAQRAGVEVVGLTSPGNLAFCESLGCYSRVLTYDQLDHIAGDSPCIYIDFAGNAGLRQRIHSRFHNLVYNCSIGGTHVGELGVKGSTRDLPGVRPTLFFAPAQIKKRSEDWGPAVLAARLANAWQAFVARVTHAETPWLKVQREDSAEQVYGALLADGGDPRIGHVLTL